jgi:hypothetical protein
MSNEPAILAGEEEAVRALTGQVLHAQGYTVLFLQRPFTPVALAQKVREVLDSPQPQPSGTLS